MNTINTFDPSGVGVKNGHFIGLPFSETEANIIFLAAPWDVTVSYSAGTSRAASNIIAASAQLDLYDYSVADAWKNGIFFKNESEKWLQINDKWRKKAKKYIYFLEQGGDINQSPKMKKILAQINEICEDFKHYIFQETRHLLAQGKLVGLVGGDHSTPLGFLEALATQHQDFGILHLDAHCDLRRAYEGFTNSHASIFYNALKINNITKITQVGIRDCCQEEIDLVDNLSEKVTIFFDHQLKENSYQGESWAATCDKIIATLPDKVYISFDIDALDPKLCPTTGTPVPGGLEYQEAVFLLEKLAKSDKKIIGFDLVEVGGSAEWDGNVAARLLYKMANLFYKKKS